MDRLKGHAASVRNTVSISGGNESEVSTTHIAIFQIGDKQVTLKSKEPVLINEGNEVVLAGKNKSGMFNALAYKNCVTGAEGNAGWFGRMLFGLFFPIVSVIVWRTFPGASFSIFPKLIASIFFCSGLYMLASGANVFRAVGAVKEATA
ncbi:hypothetical protein [Undibacterium sp. SXout20W]|uniref:hypothetical protein n=1 Tax=Undibacterium sp. SXout20W TaxID=3413051 RepID=UPI003BF1470C